jgi:adenine deaminase
LRYAEYVKLDPLGNRTTYVCSPSQDVKGVLKPGADADLVLLNDNLDVLATFVDGQVGYVREGYTLKKSEPKRK